jgi:small subunit ribosomal protein S20
MELRAPVERVETTMANIKSQKKRILTNAKAQERNKSVRAEVRTRVKVAVANGEVDSDATRDAISRIDRAAAKGIIHKNTAARKKSRLIKQLQSADA